ncbi:hypothetical protein PQR25_29285 [Paraburkholderia nemoris]|uniref:Secreted protein n=1 Tax=Paraburkholderia nemoris TaxID=2793076 RepID=A0ABN7ML33_9BURK|nr:MULTISPECIES: hypothetical protein [Paraburkholderia]MBK3814523.1 hypothetical protein [Paraburkholderia aspalathi]MBK5150938.1 hypothetical protein [Burkholderia sp. R-69608]CAE6813629.1 hypothetical protein R69776_05800 [Paraburkholderia nemoris]CAE6950186.1 hypothetical protein R69608_05772 [Paraburkholderia nemoris]
MSLDRRFYPLTQRAALALGAALLLTSAAYAAQATQPTEPADVCPALKHIVDAPDFKQLHAQPAAQLPGVSAVDDCRANTHAYDCHWRAHWQADGVVNDPLEEFGADIAACFPNVVHDVNTPTRQHFIVTTEDRRVNVTASVQGQNELRLRVTR